MILYTVIMNIALLANNIREQRKKMGFSQLTLAQRAGLSRGAIAQLETGRTHNTRFKTLEALAAALDCSMADLTEEQGPVGEHGEGAGE
jgi:transcriptional regulator with XRE-family HTH domain